MKTKSKPERRKRGAVPAAHKATQITPAGAPFHVIAMAASVGGLKALFIILGGLPADFPAAIAIVMHLSPHHKSILAEILDCRSHFSAERRKANSCYQCSSTGVLVQTARDRCAWGKDPIFPAAIRPYAHAPHE